MPFINFVSLLCKKADNTEINDRKKSYTLTDYTWQNNIKIKNSQMHLLFSSCFGYSSSLVTYIWEGLKWFIEASPTIG